MAKARKVKRSTKAPKRKVAKRRLSTPAKRKRPAPRKPMSEAARAKLRKAVQKYWKTLKADKYRYGKRRKRISKALRKWWSTHKAPKKRARWRIRQEKKRKAIQRAAVRAAREQAKELGIKALPPKARLVFMLKRTQEAFHAAGLATYPIRAVTHSDGSVEAELRVVLPRDVKTVEDLEHFIFVWSSSFAVPRDVWVATGWVFSTKGMTEKELQEYERSLEGAMVNTHYSRGEKWLTAAGGGIELMKTLNLKKRARPHEFFVRYSWNAAGERPE